MIIDYLGMLEKFHDKFGHYRFFGYRPDPETCVLRYKLIHEEVNEELLPCLKKLEVLDVSNEKYLELMVELSDAIADSLYVIFGTCVTYGIPIDEIFSEVHRSNMTKSMEKDTKSIKGKTLKGPDFEPPRIKEILMKKFYGKELK